MRMNSEMVRRKQMEVPQYIKHLQMLSNKSVHPVICVEAAIVKTPATHCAVRCILSTR